MTSTFAPYTIGVRLGDPVLEGFFLQLRLHRPRAPKVVWLDMLLFLVKLMRRRKRRASGQAFTMVGEIKSRAD